MTPAQQADTLRQTITRLDGELADLRARGQDLAKTKDTLRQHEGQRLIRYEARPGVYLPDRSEELTAAVSESTALAAAWEQAEAQRREAETALQTLMTGKNGVGIAQAALQRLREQSAEPITYLDALQGRLQQALQDDAAETAALQALDSQIDATLEAGALLSLTQQRTDLERQHRLTAQLAANLSREVEAHRQGIEAARRELETAEREVWSAAYHQHRAGLGEQLARQALAAYICGGRAGRVYGSLAGFVAAEVETAEGIVMDAYEAEEATLLQKLLQGGK